MLIKNAKILDESFHFVSADIAIENGVIAKIGNLSGDGEDYSGKIILPGLCDNHTHGCVGIDSEELSTVDEVEKMSRFYAKSGVTTFLPTIATTSQEKALSSIKTIVKAKKQWHSGASIGGIHLEGPYFSPKYAGAQNPVNLRMPSIKEFDELYEASEGLIKIISLAPELCGAQQLIAHAKNYVTVSIGHTDADEECARMAIDSGATCATHLFNAMKPLHHRNAGAVGGALDSHIFCEVICDGFHICKTVISLIYKLIGSDRMVLISDSLQATGLSDGRYSLAGLEVYVNNGQARLGNGTIAGSTSSLFDCVKKAVEFGIPIENAVKSASLTAARASGISDACGSISVGKRADLLVVDEKLLLSEVFVRGERF